MLFTLLVAGCAKDNMDSEPSASYEKIAEGYAPGAATLVEVYTDGRLTTGYNNVYIGLFDSVSKKPLQQARISLLPLMDMGTMRHAAPVENPALTPGEHNLYKGAVVFTMPSGSGSWTLDVAVEAEGRLGRLSLPLTIADPAVSRLKSFVSKADNAKFILAYLEPKAPKVGINDLEIAVFKAVTKMDYPADSSLRIVLTPEMPTMGHGSPNNVNPVHHSRGHYKGKVNFTMTGLWHVHLDFHAGTAVADTTTFFEVSF